jgi:hypothetical protein
VEVLRIDIAQAFLRGDELGQAYGLAADAAVPEDAPVLVQFQTDRFQLVD